MRKGRSDSKGILYAQCNVTRVNSEAAKEVSSMLTLKLSPNPGNFLNRTVEFRCELRHRFIADMRSCESIIPKTILGAIWSSVPIKPTAARTHWCHWLLSHSTWWNHRSTRTAEWMPINPFLGLPYHSVHFRTERPACVWPLYLSSGDIEFYLRPVNNPNADCTMLQ